ncbi:IS66 family insertion sequence element accessory protein TnpB [Ligilactobacillus agilis]|uniref:IS66 family insertion sequence element accessory protein TnpB n=1 Tax=Ligilactobacillus agilis TaxID=1601 RepID=UPI00067F0FDA|nr:IS66 family insertion sequence element accessory protein TnpB [Ligilactobacillus agilis]
MLVNYHVPKHVYIVCGNTDLRKGIDTLAILIADNFGLDFYDNSLFCGRRNDRFKALYWDGEGFILLYKRFDNGRLTWPRTSEEVKDAYICRPKVRQNSTDIDI